MEKKKSTEEATCHNKHLTNQKNLKVLFLKKYLYLISPLFGKSTTVMQVIIV